MFGPTVKPRFEGRVQGVVVHAIKNTASPSPSQGGVLLPCNVPLWETFALSAEFSFSKGCGWIFPPWGTEAAALNKTVALVAFTYLYVPGWYNSCELEPVPADGE